MKMVLCGLVLLAGLCFGEDCVTRYHNREGAEIRNMFAKWRNSSDKTMTKREGDKLVPLLKGTLLGDAGAENALLKELESRNINHAKMAWVAGVALEMLKFIADKNNMKERPDDIKAAMRLVESAGFGAKEFVKKYNLNISDECALPIVLFNIFEIEK